MARRSPPDSRRRKTTDKRILNSKNFEKGIAGTVSRLLRYLIALGVMGASG